MKTVLLVISFILLSSSGVASPDFNAYMWNRKNIESKNGKVNSKPWYEWWYYKVIIPETKQAYYFVYGVVNPWDIEHKNISSRSYVGLGDFKKLRILEGTYRVDQFASSYDETLVSLPSGQATDERITGALLEPHGEYSWDIHIKKRWSFNAEGWMLGRNITNIEWYPVQADARCSGQIIVDGKVNTFKNAPCYQDRNWGKSFPEWWTWIVSNKFDDSPDTALVIGGGRPDIFGIPSFYEGVCIGLKYKGKEYKFRPNDLDFVSVDINYGKWEIKGVSRNGKHKIVISAFAPKSKFMDLQFMTPNGEVFHDYEALLGDIDVKLFKRRSLFKGWQLVGYLHSSYAGIEYGSRNSYPEDIVFNNKMQLFSNF